MNPHQAPRWLARLGHLLAGRRQLWWQNPAAGSQPAFSDLGHAWDCTGATVSRDAISEVRRIDIDGHGYYAKYYRQPGKGWRRWLGRSRIRTEWENLRLFRELGLPVPDLVAYGEQWDSDGYRGVMVTAALANTAGLDALSERMQQREWRAAVFAQLARHLAVLHRHGFAHGDLNWRNLLITRSGEPRLFFIDCPQGRCWPWPLRSQKIDKDLWMLDKLGRQKLSRSQRLRFYLLYRGVQRLDAADKQRLRRIANKPAKRER